MLNINSKAKLNNGYKIPYLGFGVWRIEPGKETYTAVSKALEVGYRHIDTAQYYGNEADVAKAVLDSGIAREDVFITSKIAISNFGYEQTLKSFDESLKKMKLEYIDLMLLHFPINELRLESYRALEKIYKDKKVRAIGVSNFTEAHLDELLEECEVKPVINQVEFSPFLYQKGLLDYCKSKEIVLEAYSPLTKGKFLDDKKLVEIANKYDKSSAQILIRWALQHEIVVLPKSQTPSRIKENAEVFDFKISKEDMMELDKMDTGVHTSWNPYDEKIVSTFSNDIIRKLSKLTNK